MTAAWIQTNTESLLDREAAAAHRRWIEDTYEAHAPALRRFAGGRLRDPVAAEDITQESFLRLAREARSGRYPRRPRAWLFRVALNLIISGARRSATARRQPFAPTGDSLVESPETLCLVAERLDSLDAALRTLGEDGRTGLILAAQGYSIREIAAVLGRSDGATRTLLCRTRRVARRGLTD
jgi:RNA polymerase sigma-70 factor, ECF subfamily